MADIARLMQVIDPEAKALGFELVRVKLFGSAEERTLQVMAEDPATGQLVVEQCMALSRRVSDALDSIEAAGEELIAGAYHLEVSSPGIDRPLTRPADYAKWAGHEVRISLAEKIDGRRELHGDLIGLLGPEGAQGVAVDDRKSGRVEVPFSGIHAAKLVLTDRLIAATKPLDTSGIDEFEETLEEEKADD
jgi:ribosome maturation factor RimP